VAAKNRRRSNLSDYYPHQGGQKCSPFVIKFRPIINRIPEPRGINIHDPKYGVLLDKKFHQSINYTWDKEWAKFISGNPNATVAEVEQFVNTLAEKVGIPEEYLLFK